MNFKSILLGAALAVSPVFGFADSNIKMVVGTYTDAGSQGLYSFSFDQSTGKASGITSLKVDNPSYFTFSKEVVISMLLARRIMRQLFLIALVTTL